MICRKKYYDEREVTYGSIEQARRRSKAAGEARAREMRERGQGREGKEGE